MGKSDKKAKKKHKSERKQHKEKNKDKVKKSRKHEKAKKPKESPSAANNEMAPAIPPPNPPGQTATADSGSEEDFAIPIALMNSKSHAPETPEEYQRRQSQIRREVDPVTGRTRIIKGDSEILEEIVSKQRHGDINRKATSGDGEYFEAQSFANAVASKRRSKPK
ncbi:ADP-ribosylation factor-like protein 6-interacting protein 4 [Drosophila grimshawi]|uniref:ADP-ribosylation factor-like protein 6-interacting protein 4 n=1 Tax=Drosophila grimshawi TaxID=7222 RepID=B4JIG9_DROGR|nr:ADP-ribosylation factor-like protein 6-interacting protein 4 [Drosophila grimshawi]EDV93050.1 GH18492 [Drosophila grimshawi]